MRRLIRYRLLVPVVIAVAVALAACGLLRPSAPAAGPEAVLDHYLCYFFDVLSDRPPLLAAS